MPKISIIVPVYNVEKYLPRCLDSILAQTFRDWECLVIDDGSTDSSGTICDEYASRDHRFKVFHKENGGVSSARNYGLSIANGEYASFVDADDWLDITFYDTLICRGNNADAIICDILSEHGTYSKVIRTFSFDGDIIKFLNYEIAYGWNSVCKMIVKRSVLNEHNIRFEHFRYNEDYVFSVNLFCVVRNIVVINNALYHYNRTNETSALHNMPINVCMEIISAEESVTKYLKEYGLYPSLEKVISWRIIRAKQDLVLEQNLADQFLMIHPETHRYILSSPIIGFKMKILMLLLIHNNRTILNFILKLRSKKSIESFSS